MSQLRHQSGIFVAIHFKHEIHREALRVAPYLLIETACLDAIERGQILVQQHLLSTDNDDGLVPESSAPRILHQL
jgi:hypothetical protein